MVTFSKVSSLIRTSLSLIFPRDGRRLIDLHESSSDGVFLGLLVKIILTDFLAFGKNLTLSMLLNMSTRNLIG